MGAPYPYPECKVNNAFGNITEIILDIVVCSLLTYLFRIFYKNQNDVQRPNIFKDRIFYKVYDHAFSLKGDHFPSTKKKIYMNLCLFQVQNNGSSANLMPHDIADLGGWWRNLKLITVGNVKVLIKVTAPPQTSTWTKK